jgi:PadR family transcriptional regulator, regulatory protein PadR
MLKRKTAAKQTSKRADLLQGMLDMLILKSLASGARHGYGIAQQIQQSSEDMLKVEEGSLYPALYRLENQGWIRAEWGVSENNRRAKFYSLTASGRKQLTIETSNWHTLREAISRVLETA